MDLNSISPPTIMKKYSKTLFIQPSSPKSPIPHLKDYLSFLKKNNRRMSNLKNTSITKRQNEPSSSLTKSKNLTFIHDLSQTAKNNNEFTINSKNNNLDIFSNKNQEIGRRDKNKKFYFPNTNNYELDQENKNFDSQKNHNLKGEHYKKENYDRNSTQIDNNIKMDHEQRGFSKNQINYDLSHFSKNNEIDYDLNHLHLTKGKLKRNVSEFTEKNEEFYLNPYKRNNLGNNFKEFCLNDIANNINLKDFPRNNIGFHTNNISPKSIKNFITLNRCNSKDFNSISKIHNSEELATNLKNIFLTNNSNTQELGVQIKINNNSHFFNDNSSNNATSHRNNTTIKKNDKSNEFHLRPTSFGETLKMIEKKIKKKIGGNRNLNEETSKIIKYVCYILLFFVLFEFSF